MIQPGTVITILTTAITPRSTQPQVSSLPPTTKSTILCSLEKHIGGHLSFDTGKLITQFKVHWNSGACFIQLYLTIWVTRQKLLYLSTEFFWFNNVNNTISFILLLACGTFPPLFFYRTCNPRNATSVNGFYYYYPKPQYYIWMIYICFYKCFYWLIIFPIQEIILNQAHNLLIGCPLVWCLETFHHLNINYRLR